MARKLEPKKPMKSKPRAARATGTTLTLKDALHRLEALGDEKMRAYNAKHGAGDKQFGVKQATPG